MAANQEISKFVTPTIVETETYVPSSYTERRPSYISYEWTTFMSPLPLFERAYLQNVYYGCSDAYMKRVTPLTESTLDSIRSYLNNHSSSEFGIDENVFSHRAPIFSVYHSFSAVDLAVMCDRYSDSFCSFCGVANVLFKGRGASHREYHEKFSISFAYLCFPVVRDVYDVAIFKPPPHCTLCLGREDSFLNSQHHQFTHELLFNSFGFGCLRCFSLFDSVDDLQCHTVNHHLVKHVFENSGYLQSVCDVRACKQQLQRSYLTNLVVKNHILPLNVFKAKREFWIEYNQRLDRAKIRKDSGSVALDLLRINKAKKLYLPRLLSKIAKCDLSDLEMQFSLFDVNVNLLPDKLIDAFKEAFAACTAKLDGWKQSLIRLTKKFYDEYGKLIVIVISILLLKLADHCFGSNTWWSIFSFVCCYIMSCQQSMVLDEKDQRIADLELYIETFGPADPTEDSPQLSKDSLENLLPHSDNSIIKIISIVVRSMGLILPTAAVVSQFLDFCKMTNVTANALRNWKSLLEFILNKGKDIYVYFAGSEEERALLRFRNADGVVDWMFEVQDLDSEMNRRLLYFSDNLQERVYRAQKQGFHYLALSVEQHDSKIESTVRYILRSVDLLVKEANRARFGAGFRFDPMAIQIEGKAGIGKSSSMGLLAKAIYSEYDDSRVDFTYGRVPGQKFWNNYRRQKVILMDDAFCGGGDRYEQAVTEFIDMKTNTAFTVEQAAIEDKDMYFEGELILFTTNGLGLNLNNVVVDPQAVYRRIDLCVSMKLKKEFCGSKSQDSINVRDVDKVPARVRDKMEHVEMHVVDPMDNFSLIKVLSWADFVEYAKLQFAKHVLKQKKIMTLNGARLPKLARSMIAEMYVDLEKHPQLADGTIPKDRYNGNLYNYAQWTGGNPHRVIQSTFVDYNAMDETDEPGHGSCVDRLCVEEDSLMREQITKPKLLRYFDDCVKQFQSMWQGCRNLWKRAQEFFQDNKIRILIGMVGGIAGLYSASGQLIKMFSGGLVDLTMEMTPSGDERTSKFGRRKLIVRRPVLKDLKIQGSTDPNAMELVKHRLPSNVYTVQVKGPIGTIAKMYCIALGGRVLMMPRHFFMGMEEGSTITVSDGKVLFEELVDERKIRELDELDICSYEMSARFPLQKKIAHLFIDENDVSKIQLCEGAMFTLQDGSFYTAHGDLSPIDARDKATYKGSCNGETQAYLIRKGFRLNVPSSVGDCGAPVIAFDPKLAGKFVGIHVAGRQGQNLSVSVLVTKQITEFLLSQYETGDLSTSDFNGKYLGEDVPLLEIEGNFTEIGTVSKEWALRQPEKHDIVESILHDKIFKHTTEPSILHPKDPRNESGESPLKKGVEKYGTPTKMMPLDLVDFACKESDAEELQILRWPRGRDRNTTIEMDYVMKGDGSNTHNVNTKSSPGWPLVHEGKGRKGKTWLIDVSDDGKYTPSPRLIDEMKKVFESWSRLERDENSVWSDCLKTERRKLAKVASASTRVFTIAPLAFSLCARVFLIDYLTAFHKAYLKFYSATGMDPESYDWETMLQRLEEVGLEGFDGDFEKYDAKLMPELMQRAMSNVSDFYDLYVDSISFDFGRGCKFTFSREACRKIREIIVDELIHPRQLVLNVLYMSHQGNPSGNLMTTPMNSKVNDYLGRIGFYGVYSRHMVKKNNLQVEKWFLSVGLYSQHVRNMAYGDDNGYSVSPEMKDIFNFETYSKFLAEFGITYTAADKSDTIIPYKPLNQLRFLKRGTADWGWIRVPTIDVETIQEMINWVRADNEQMKIEQSYVNIEGAMRFAFFHGRAYFDDLKSKVNKALIDAGHVPVSHSWDLFNHDFKNRVS